MANLITAKTKTEIIKLSTFLANIFYSENKTDLISISKDEGLSIITDNYGEYFDGMLVYDRNKFYIHLNTGKGNRLETKRGRFTLAHELAHYFIDLHREGIRKGLIPPHPSNNSLIHSNKMEAEADYFASCLLMPQQRLRTFTGGRKFSFKIIEEISKSFDVSLTAAAIRFAEIGTHEVMVVFSQNNIVKWYCNSSDFPKLPFKFKVGSALPPTSVAGESFKKNNSKYITVEPVDVEDWFYVRDWAPQSQMYEQCFYSDQYNYVISLIWFE